MALPLEMRRAFAKRLTDTLNSAGVPEVDHALHLGKLADVSSQLPQRWLQGLAVPSRTTLSHIAKLLNVKPEWLLKGSGDMKPSHLQQN